MRCPPTVPESFLSLSGDERSQLLQTISSKLGRTAAVLEKDVWVCWTLEQLFAMPDPPAMAFKGGTSLSKVYDAIHRFSEDLDVTVDYRSFGDEFDPFGPKVSGTQLKKFRKRLHKYLQSFSHERVVPYLYERLVATFAADKVSIEVSDDGEKITLGYPSAVARDSGYIKESVLIELGGRNITEPHESHTITPYMAAELSSLQFPTATVDVLSPRRTFWEKATLIHAECNRRTLRADANRISRHWHDVFMLADHAVGHGALADRAMLEDVVKFKKVFFGSPDANYDACLQGELKLVPDDALQTQLRNDLNDMIKERMFWGGEPDFDKMIVRLKALEDRINKT